MSADDNRDLKLFEQMAERKAWRIAKKEEKRAKAKKVSSAKYYKKKKKERKQLSKQGELEVVSTKVYLDSFNNNHNSF